MLQRLRHHRRDTLLNQQVAAAGLEDTHMIVGQIKNR